MIESKHIVLTLSSYYLPGYKGGGCIRAVANLIAQLGNQFHFKVVTRDRDLGEISPYPEIQANSWETVDLAEVLYLDPQNRSFAKLRNIICQTEHQVLYLNSFFSPDFTIKILLLRKLRLIPHVPLILAPRGEFCQKALALKSNKKRIYLAFAKLLGLYDGITWQATGLDELSDIVRETGKNSSVMIAPELPSPIVEEMDSLVTKDKVSGGLNILFLSRICRVKNLIGAIEMLKGLKGKINFNIYGPIEDDDYWQECQQVINSLDANIQVQYHGAVSPDKVSNVMQSHDLFFLPSLGESFGYVIFEALIAGCPILISDRTIWRGLEQKGVGWDLSLDRTDLFKVVLQQCVDMDRSSYMQWSQTAREYGLEYSKNKVIIAENMILFSKAISQSNLQ
jgi:glycosyltransferase involved in cell wall biosynthesis